MEHMVYSTVWQTWPNTVVCLSIFGKRMIFNNPQEVAHLMGPGARSGRIDTTSPRHGKPHHFPQGSCG